MSSPGGDTLAPERSAAPLALEGQRRRVVTVLVATVGVALVAWWGDTALAGGRVLHLGAPPFYGTWRSEGVEETRQWWWPAVAAVIALMVLVPTWWTRSVRKLRWPLVLLGSWGFAMAWSTALAATSGVDRIAEPLLDSRYEYLPLAREIQDPAGFVSSFVETISTRPTHVRGHPPGAVLAFMGLDRVFSTDLRVALAVIAAGALAAPLTLVAVRALSDEQRSRRVAVFAGLAPAAVWMGTSADAMFTGVVAAAVAFGALGWAAQGNRSVLWWLAAGSCAGLAMTLTWGAPALLAPLAVIWLAVILDRRWGAAGAAAVGGIVVCAALAVAGFDWLAGAEAVREEYFAGVGSSRPRIYFLFANLAAFAVALGPATVGAVSTLAHRRLWWLVGGALAGVLLANASGLSKGEVERIWLPAVPWVVVATASIRVRRQQVPWVVATMVVAVVIEWRLFSPW